jgi:hypothetical protein
MRRTFICLSVALLLFITITMQAAAQPNCGQRQPDGCAPDEQLQWRSVHQ